MELFNRLAEITGYTVLVIGALGICGTTAAWVNDLIRRDREDQYPEYGWSREVPRYNSLWDQVQASTGAPPPELVPAQTGDTPGREV